MGTVIRQDATIRQGEQVPTQDGMTAAELWCHYFVLWCRAPQDTRLIDQLAAVAIANGLPLLLLDGTTRTGARWWRWWANENKRRCQAG